MSRLPVTLAAVLIVIAGMHIPLPLLDLAGAEQAGMDTSYLSPFTLGLTPLLTAFVLVELAALAHPGWRWLRHGGSEARQRLTRAALALGVVLAMVQSTALTASLAQMTDYSGSLLWPTDARSLLERAALWLTPIGGTCALIALSRVVDRAGVGSGIAVVMMTPAGLLLAEQATSLHGSDLLIPYLLLLAMSAALVGLATHPRAGLPRPLSGLVPVQVAAGLAGMLPLLVPTLLPSYRVEAALAVVLTGGLMWLFNRPDRVAALWGERSPRWSRSAAETVAFIGLTLAVMAWARSQDLAGALVLIAVPLAALVLDIADELRDNRRAQWVSVWPEHRLYALAPIQHALQAADIPCSITSTRLRSLMQFFGPYVPMHFRVPAGQEAAALAVIEALPHRDTDAPIASTSAE